jgi:lipopolysaccharide heptosyltransferase I
MTPPRKILVLKLSSLGDILHTLPAFHALRSTFPEARIDWVVEDRLSFLLQAVEGIDHIIPIDTRALRQKPARRESWGALLRPIQAVRRVRYDIVIDFQGLMKTAFLAFASGAVRRIGFARDIVREPPAHWFYHDAFSRPGGAVHVARLNLCLAQAAGARSDDLRAGLKSDPADEEFISQQLRREQLSDFVVINPGGGWPTKRWRPTRYGELAARLQNETRNRVVVTTGPGEEYMLQEIADACPARPPVALSATFLQLIPLFRRARLVISGDTGPMHLACALSAPVVAIMGPTAPVRNGPWSNRDEVVVHQLPCSYCNGRSCPTQNECMDISVEEVFDAALRRLER